MGKIGFSPGSIVLDISKSWGQAKTVEEAISGFKAEIAELKEGVSAGKHSKVFLHFPPQIWR